MFSLNEMFQSFFLTQKNIFDIKKRYFLKTKQKKKKILRELIKLKPKSLII